MLFQRHNIAIFVIRSLCCDTKWTLDWIFSPHMTSVVGTLHVGKYMRSRYTFHFFIHILSLFYTDFVAILYLFCRQLGVRRCFVRFLSLFHTTFVAKLELTPIYAKFVAKLELTPIYAKFVAKLVLVAKLYRFCRFFIQILLLFHTPFVAKSVFTLIHATFIANLVLP